MGSVRSSINKYTRHLNFSVQRHLMHVSYVCYNNRFCNIIFKNYKRNIKAVINHSPYLFQIVPYLTSWEPLSLEWFTRRQKPINYCKTPLSTFLLRKSSINFKVFLKLLVRGKADKIEQRKFAKKAKNTKIQ